MRGLCRSGNPALRNNYVPRTSIRTPEVLSPLSVRKRRIHITSLVLDYDTHRSWARIASEDRDGTNPLKASPTYLEPCSEDFSESVTSRLPVDERDHSLMTVAKSRSDLRRFLKGASDGRGSNLFQLQQTLPPHQWKTYMLQSIQLQSKRPRTLFKIFQELERVTYSSLRDPALYTALLRHFVQMRHWSEATIVWHRLLARCLEGIHDGGLTGSKKWELDHEGLSLGVVLLCQHMRRFDEAFHMVDKLGSAHATSLSTISEATSSPAGPTTALINTLIKELRLVGRFETVHLLWRAMGERYNIPRDKETLLQVMYAANFGSIGGESDSMQGRLESLAISVAEQFSRMLRERRKAKEARLNHNTRSWEIQVEESLRRPIRLPEDEFWDGLIAWQRARLIFLEVILGRYPGLLRLETLPLCWIEPSQELLLSKPFSTSDVHSHHIEFKDRSDPHQIPDHAPPIPLYPEIDLDSDTFLAYIWLLGEHGLASQISVTITWMRALSIVPSQRTLAYAFCFVEDTQSPLQHRYGSDTSYFKLRFWVTAWLGSAALPSDDQIIEARTRILGRRSPKVFPENTTRRISPRARPTNQPTR